MPLQIRRGSNAQRTGIIFAEGEIVYTIDTKKLYVGDGSTTGGIAIDSTLNYPTQTGNQGKFLTTDGSIVSWASVLPTQTGNNGKYLTTDGSTLSWDTVDALDAFPPQTGNEGKVLTTNGSTVSWSTVNPYPNQGGNQGKFLTTDGTSVNWATVDTYPDQTGNDGKFLSTNGSIVSWTEINLLPNQAGNFNKILRTDGISASWDNQYPVQTGNEGKVLTTNGLTVSWTSVDAFPTQTNNAGKFLVTDGTTVSWTTNLQRDLDLNTYGIVGAGRVEIDGLIHGGDGNFTGALVLNAVGIGSGIQVNGTASAGDTNAFVSVNSARVNKTLLQSGDLLGSYSCNAWNGVDYHKGSVFSGRMATNIVNGDFGVDTIISTLNSDGNYRDFVFKNTGLIEALGFSFAPTPTVAIQAFLPFISTGTLAFDSTRNQLVVDTGAPNGEYITTSVPVPTLATDPGSPGQIAYDATHIYVCIAPNSWIRANASSW